MYSCTIGKSGTGHVFNIFPDNLLLQVKETGNIVDNEIQQLFDISEESFHYTRKKIDKPLTVLEAVKIQLTKKAKQKEVVSIMMSYIINYTYMLINNLYYIIIRYGEKKLHQKNKLAKKGIGFLEMK